MPVEIESPNASASRRDEIMERLFTDLQVARFNQLYYRTRAKSVRRLIKCTNIIAAISASAAVITLLKDSGAFRSLQVMMIIAAVAAAVAPVLGLEDKYSQLETAALGHSLVGDRIWNLLRDLKISLLDESHEAREQEIAAVRDGLSALDEEPHESVKRACWDKVQSELPAEKAWTIV